MTGIKRLVSVLLCIALCAGLCTCFAVAEKDTYKIVCIGDSTTNGYDLDDYGLFSPYRESYFYMSQFGELDLASRDSFPYRLQSYIQNELMPDRNVILTVLACKGIRSDEIRGFLDHDYTPDAYGQYFSEEVSTAFQTCFGVDPYTLYPEELRSADLVTLDFCMNNFGNYLVMRIITLLTAGSDNFYTSGSIEELIESVTPETERLIESTVTKMLGALTGVLPEGSVKKIGEAVSFCLADFCINFSAIVRWIYENNPDVRLMVCGTFNPISKGCIKIGGIELNVAELVDLAMGVVDTYMTALDANCGRYNYIDLTAGLETFADVFSQTESAWELSDVMHRRMLRSIYSDDQLALGDVMTSVVSGDASAKGITVSGVSLQDAYAAYEDVLRNGDNASEKNRIISDNNERVIRFMLDSFKDDCYEIDSLADILETGAFNSVTANAVLNGREYGDLTEAERLAVRFSATVYFANGAAIHPSYRGCAQKYEAVKKAYDEGLPASSHTGQVAADMGIHASLGLLSALRAPLLNALDKVLSAFDLSSLFSGLMQRIYSLFRPVC